MVTIDPIAEASTRCDAIPPASDDFARELVDVVAGKWPLWVLHVLAEEGAPLRFSRVLERVDGISQKMLTQTLRTLERYRLVTRTLYPQVPPRVDYEVTQLGRELLLQVLPLWHWVIDHIADFQSPCAAGAVPEEVIG